VADTVIRREMKVLKTITPNGVRKSTRSTEGKGEKPDPKHPFRVWLGKQPDEYQKKINGTDSPLVVSKALDKFKADQKAKAEKPKPPPKQKSRGP
jgi:hypothetical protein